MNNTSLDSIIKKVEERTLKNGDTSDLEQLKELYELARKISPGRALKLSHEAETAEARKFFAFVSDMNLQRAQTEVLKGSSSNDR